MGAKVAPAATVAGVNRLADETSPYLRQHRDNPVDWHPWGGEAFALAEQLDRPILLSVGYSACHWCHVMAHESFEDDEVAASMNARFVNIKVDREERPDVDAVYMDAVQAMTGRGGWPMTVFLAPDGRPFFGGTYYPKPGFLRLLEAVDEAWRTKRDDLLAQAGQLTASLNRFGELTPASAVPGVEHLNAALEQLAKAWDREWGGFGAAPKFPQTDSLELILRAHAAGAGDGALQVVTHTLDAMASGGIYDHLGGGFARYSVDERWLVPHFEKMLYDQALLTRIYLHAWQVTGEARFRQVLDETVAYVLRDLRHPSGGFYSAEDADSLDASGHSHEGAFYVWTPGQMREILGTDLAAEAMAWYGVTDGGNFEGANILHRPEPGALLRPAAIDEARQLLFAAREHRPRPGLDDKVLTEWNGLMVASLAEAAAATGEEAWLEAALVTGQFLLDELRRDGRWMRSWQADATPAGTSASRARHLALAADYAALVNAFIALGEASGQARWIAEARTTADAMLDLFWDPTSGGLFTTGDDGEALIARQKDLLDNATPSANSLAAVGLLRLAALTGELRYANHVDQILQLVGPLSAQSAQAFAHLLIAVDLRRTGVTEIAVVGDRPDLVAAVLHRYLPNAVVAWGEPYDSPLWASRDDGWAYVCRNYACRAPVDTIDDLVAQISG
jgi:uncharacterized protein YyaL (SSP411 family)